MDDPETFVNPPNMVSTSLFAGNKSGYAKGVLTYTVMDVLIVTPMSTISSITMLHKFNIKQLDALEEKVVNVGTTEGVEILKASLWSETLLTDVFLVKKARKKRFSVIKLLTKEQMVGSFGNLYDSLENMNDTYIHSPENKGTLLKPIIPNNAANVPPLSPTLEFSKPIGIYRCGNYPGSNCGLYVSNDSKSICPSCNNVMNQTATNVNPKRRIHLVMREVM
ncbi:DUF674 domain-containing protein [Gossypium australe]|uniref:DUF674 domain-containing protein n=1 Tax=Gossypium australe TaxID=47621 RepID=A0A5B6WII4_9ROSI|nr:DUF674 domain-containing protein [Gossypium australe]